MRQLLIYWFDEISPKDRTKFNRELYGYTDTSNFGKYNYKREGLLKDFKKITKGVVLLEKKQSKLSSFLKNSKAKYKVFKILS